MKIRDLIKKLEQAGDGTADLEVTFTGGSLEYTIESLALAKAGQSLKGGGVGGPADMLPDRIVLVGRSTY